MQIKLSLLKNVFDAVKAVSGLFSLTPSDSIDIELDYASNDLKPECLAIVAAAISYARSNGVNVTIKKSNVSKDSKKKNSKTKSKAGLLFAEKLGFTGLLDYKATKRDIGIIELKSNKENNDIINKTMQEMWKNFSLEESVYKCINYCLWEQIDNIENHANCEGPKYLMVWENREQKTLSVCVIDTGIGIHKALTTDSESTYKYFTAKEAVEKCINEKVTNGKGKGNGLYHNGRFIDANDGKMIIYSGNYYTEKNKNGLATGRVPYWQGTIVYQKINTQVTVDFDEIFTNTEVPTSVLECHEMVNNLW